MMHQRVKAQTSIEALLVWAFQTEKAPLFGSTGRDLTAGYPEDSTVRAQRNNVLGGFIRGTDPGARAILSNSADDAELVAEVVRALKPWPLANLMWSYGMAGARPDWKPEAWHHWRPAHAGLNHARGVIVPTDEPRRWKPHKIRLANGKRISAPAPRWCEVVEVDAPCVIDAYRRQYSEWVDTLALLRGRLSGRLARWTLDATLPPREPWKPVARARVGRKT